jgi:hypothetical protein
MAMASAAVGWIVGACLGLAGPDAPASRPGHGLAADSVTLRDGKNLLGVLIESAPRGSTWLYVRRDWARQHLPDWARRWEAAEAPRVKRAVAQRRDRLAAWRRERGAPPKPAAGDRVSIWIDREIARIDAGEAATSTLMEVRLNRGDVRPPGRPARGASRLLRLGWLAKLPNPEAMKIDALKDALEARGLDPTAPAPAPVDKLLPQAPETDATWLVRRAATEVSFDPGLRFIRYEGVVLPEPEPGQPPAPGEGAGLLALSAIKDLLGENPEDPLLPRLRQIEARGRSGAVVTRLQLEPDFSRVTAEIVLCVRQAPGRWVPAGSRSARVMATDLGPDAGNGLAEDPQVSLAFRIVEAIGLGGVTPEMKRRALGLGAASQRALGLARSAAQADLSALELPVRDAPAPAPR